MEDGVDERGGPDHGGGDAGEVGDLRRNGPARVDEGLKAAQTLAPSELHRPDLVLTCKRGLVVPIEVELSTKAASRLAAICRGWARARHIHTVYYLAAPGPARAVQRAIGSTKTGDRIRVLELDDIPTLADEQYAAEDHYELADPIDDEGYEVDPSTNEAYQ